MRSTCGIDGGVLSPFQGSGVGYHVMYQGLRCAPPLATIGRPLRGLQARGVCHRTRGCAALHPWLPSSRPLRGLQAGRDGRRFQIPGLRCASLLPSIGRRLRGLQAHETTAVSRGCAALHPWLPSVAPFGGYRPQSDGQRLLHSRPHKLAPHSLNSRCLSIPLACGETTCNVVKRFVD